MMAVSWLNKAIRALVPAARPTRPPETAVAALFVSLSEAQRREVCFDWNYQDETRGLLRSFVANHWQITRLTPS